MKTAKLLTDIQRLKLINELVSNNDTFESVLLDIVKQRRVGEREEILAGLIEKIFRITHPCFSTCLHPEWEKETKNLLTSINSK